MPHQTIHPKEGAEGACGSPDDAWSAPDGWPRHAAVRVGFPTRMFAGKYRTLIKDIYQVKTAELVRPTAALEALAAHQAGMYQDLMAGLMRGPAEAARQAMQQIIPQFRGQIYVDAIRAASAHTAALQGAGIAERVAASLAMPARAALPAAGLEDAGPEPDEAEDESSPQSHE
ncbi:hypothetical protein [Streptomyces sp. NPDC058613]|uniref:hypothetical protein n=1 Tax=Streptomyces sp. NPDC058613 TaxID=3346556 RepID=UPI003647328F